jgi:hypothetical protein
VVYLLKARTVELEKQPLLGNGCVTHNSGVTVGSGVLWAVPVKACNEDHLPLRESVEVAVRRVGGWCEVAATLQGCEPRSRGMSTVVSHYQAL